MLVIFSYLHGHTDMCLPTKRKDIFFQYIVLSIHSRMPMMMAMPFRDEDSYFDSNRRHLRSLLNSSVCLNMLIDILI